MISVEGNYWHPSKGHLGDILTIFVDRIDELDFTLFQHQRGQQDPHRLGPDLLVGPSGLKDVTWD
jgi:hypothetical protein